MSMRTRPVAPWEGICPLCLDVVRADSMTDLVTWNGRTWRVCGACIGAMRLLIEHLEEAGRGLGAGGRQTDAGRQGEDGDP